MNGSLGPLVWLQMKGIHRSFAENCGNHRHCAIRATAADYKRLRSSANEYRHDLTGAS